MGFCHIWPPAHTQTSKHSLANNTRRFPLGLLRTKAVLHRDQGSALAGACRRKGHPQPHGFSEQGACQGWEGRTGEHEVAEMQQLPQWHGVIFSSLQGLGCPETRSPSNSLFLSTIPSSHNVCIQTLTLFLIHCLRVFNHLDKYACKIFPRSQATGTKHSAGLKKQSRISLLGPTTKPVKHKATARVSKA